MSPLSAKKSFSLSFRNSGFFGMMAGMDEKTVDTLANLARIEMSAEEKKEILADLSDILGYVEAIRAAGDAETRNAPEWRNVFRGDENPHEAGAYSDTLIAAAPDSHQGYIKVKKILP